MRFLIVGAGGVGSYYGTKLLNSGHEVIFIARGAHLQSIHLNGLHLRHPRFSFDQKVNIMDIDSYKSIGSSQPIDAILLTTKSTSTKLISKELVSIFSEDNTPFIISLQNGVENEDILCEYFPRDKIIGGLTRKIGAHIIKPGIIEATGDVETIVGLLQETKKGKTFLENFSKAIEACDISCEITHDIKKELWKKLIINNGVNAICALLKIKTGVLMGNEKLSKIVYGLMLETASASKVAGVEISKEDIDGMFELITHFDSIKPSMLVDVEHKRELELDEICGVVIKNCELQNIDAPYTRTIATLLEFTYNKELKNG